MPVLINNETNLAEDIPQESADTFVQQGSHSIPLVDRDGNLINATPTNYNDLLQQGHTLPTSDQLNSLITYAHHSSPLEQLKTIGEGIGRGVAGPVFTGAERLLGAKSENIQGREETNPSESKIGEAIGIIAPGLTSIATRGALKIPALAGLMSKVGEGAAALSGIGEGSALAKIGSRAVKDAAEMAILQSSDEASKLLIGDPDQSAGTALANVGISALIGAGGGAVFGSVPAIWGLASKTKMGQILSGIQQKLGGVEGLTPSVTEKAIEALGIDVPKEIRGALESNPAAQRYFQELMSSDTWAGKQAQDALLNTRKEVANGLLNTLGKTPEDLHALENMSEHDLGLSLKDSLTNELSNITEPAGKAFENIKAKFSNVPLPEQFHNEISEKLSTLMQNEGLDIANTPESALVQRVLKDLPNLDGKSLEGLRKFQSALNGWTSKSPELYRIGSKVGSILREAETDLITKSAIEKSPELLDEITTARQNYRSVMNLIDDMNERIHVGNYSGPQGFITALKELKNEDLLKRLSPKKDAAFLGTLSQKFPQTANAIKENYLNQAIKSGTKNLRTDEIFNPKGFLGAVQGWSPELRNFAITPEMQAGIENTSKILGAIPPPANPSGTAGMLDSLWKKVPGSTLGIISLLSGHNPLMAPLVYALTSLVNREGPEALKLGMLKFFGSASPVSAEGFKALVDFTHALQKGGRLIERGAESLFRPDYKMPTREITPRDRQKLDEKIQELKENPTPLIEAGGHIPYYLPEHGTSLGKIASTAIEYLDSIRPQEGKIAPFDAPRVPSQSEKEKYERALDIADQPLKILEHIKDGTLLSQDIRTLSTIYPGLYVNMRQKVTDKLIQHANKNDNKIPYKTRLGLSLFLGQNLDSTMSTQGIQFSQMALMANQTQKQMNQMQQTKPSKSGMRQMKSINQDLTVAQRATARHGRDS